MYVEGIRKGAAASMAEPRSSETSQPTAEPMYGSECKVVGGRMQAGRAGGWWASRRRSVGARSEPNARKVRRHCAGAAATNEGAAGAAAAGSMAAAINRRETTTSVHALRQPGTSSAHRLEKFDQTIRGDAPIIR